MQFGGRIVPSKSKAQHNLMAAVANNPKFAKRVGISRSVGREFVKADEGRKFAKGGDMKESKAMMRKEVGFMKKAGAPKSMIKHEEAEMRASKPKKMMGGGMAEGNMMAAKGRGMAKAGMQKKMPAGYAAGGRIASKGEHPVQRQAKRGAQMVKMARGGKTC